MELNTDQKRAAEHAGSHLMVLAGAGTGKTRTIIARAAHLIATGTDPRRILVLTFTRKAASELVGRLKFHVGAAAEQVRAGTFHAFCLHTMRHFPKAFGLDHLTILDRDDQIELLGMVRAGIVPAGDKSVPKRERIAELISYARNTNVGFKEYLAKLNEFQPAVIEKLDDVLRAYSTRKRLRNYVDYDDLLWLFARTLHSPSMEDVRRMIAGQFDHVLVDEMQDTNPIQWLILDALHEDALLFCVGDDAQSIYAFRGADFENVHSFRDRVPGGQILPLFTNYRSTQAILDLANWLLAQSPLNYDKQLESVRGPGKKPMLVEFDNSPDEAAWIVQDILDRLESGTKLKDMMILVRAAWMTRDLEAALIENHIDYIFIGGTKLMNTAHVKDLLAMLRAAISPRDELAWSRYLRFFEGIGDVLANRVIDKIAPLTTPAAALELLPALLTETLGSKAALARIAEGLQTVAAAAAKPEAAVTRAVEFLIPIQKKRYPNWSKRARDYELLIMLAKRHKSLDSFLETYTLDPVAATFDTKPEGKDLLTLITVHSAKGTEAKVAYVMKVQPGIYPYNRALADLKEIEEERRILYVAMTRAMDELIITRVDERFGSPVFYGGSSGRFPSGGTSDFIADLPENLVQRDIKAFRPSPFEDMGPIKPRFRATDN